MFRKVRTRLIVTYTALILLGFLGLALLAGQQISLGVTEDFQQNFVAQATLTARGLREPLEDYFEGESTEAFLQTAVTDFADELDTPITLLDAEGQLWLTSNGQPENTTKKQPEVEAALNQHTEYDIRNNENNVATIYAAAPIIEDGRILAVVRLETPQDTAQSLVVQRWLALATGVLGITVVVIIASFALAASLTRPLTQLNDAALTLADGRLSHRLPENRTDEFGKLAQTFNHMAQQVESMIEEQRAFASNASHELRTPLTTIRLRSEALRDGGLDAQTAQKYVAEIDDEVTRLGNLVNDLILLSRLDSGRAELGSDQVSIASLVKGLLLEFQPQIEEKQLIVTTDVPHNLPPVAANSTHLRVVLHNLLSNSVKYTPSGGKINWQWAADTAVVHMTLTDSGQGIAPEDLPHLFERFYRADKARTRTVVGTGLGLSLSQSIVQLYNGRLQISSPGLNQGTRVRLTWPQRLIAD
ncbi:ATP-binding protein [Candidatus Leptofilum sp.]|uniref:sensor histidine kinase n=1 Tax=Candidatus Leptofilum sp. TaxID=3241576 RepID=UPI003B5CBA1B